MAKSRDNSQKSQAESSVKRLMKKMRKKDKDKSPTVEPKKPVESPKPDDPAPPAVAAVATSHRRVRRRRVQQPKEIPKIPYRRHRSYRDYNNFVDDPEAMPHDREPCPKRTWLTTSKWPIPSLREASLFLCRYAEMGVEGMKAEFKKEIEGYKSPDYADTQWKANPTKNRDKDHMTCLDGTRVEFEDKKKYINASWVFDTQLVQQKYILTQVPIVPETEGAESTLEEFYEMHQKNFSKYIIYFRDLKEEPMTPIEDREKGPYGKVLRDQFYPARADVPLELSNIYVTNRGQAASREFFAEPYTLSMTPIKCPVEDKHEHKEIVKTNNPGVKGCLNKYQSCKVSETYRWSEIAVQDQLYTIAQIEGDRNRKRISPIVVMDDFSGTSRAAVFVAIDVLGSLLYSGADNVTIAMVVKWIRRCRNGAIRNADEYIFIYTVLFRVICPYPGILMSKKVEAKWNEIIDEENRRAAAYREEIRKEEEKKAAEEKAIKDEKERKEREEKAEQDRQEQLREASEKKKEEEEVPILLMPIDS